MKPIISLLQEFRFTESEAKVYVALLENGASTGYEISKQSGVARSKIYNILNALVQRGVLLCSQEEKSTLYRAVPIKLLSSVIRKQVGGSLDRLQQEGEMLLTQHGDDRIWHLYDWESAKCRCLEMIHNARDEVLLQIWVNELDSELESCIRSKQETLGKVSVILYDVTGKYQTSIPKFYRHGFEQDKLRELGGRWVTVAVDWKEMIYISFSDAGMNQAIYSKNADMVLFAREYVYHDAYCLRLIDRLGEQAVKQFGLNLEGVRDIFSL